MEPIFAYIAGLLTLINPCVLPVLPIVLASALQSDKRGPLALALGMSISFVAFGMFVAVFGRAVGLTSEKLSDIGAWMMIGFGLILLVKPLNILFERAFSGLSQNADRAIDNQSAEGLRGQFVAGLLLGIVWSPCIGPTLGGAIALASGGESLLWALIIMIGFALGVSTVIILLGLGGQGLIRNRANALKGIAEKSKPVMGVIFIGVGAMILLRLHYKIEILAIKYLPHWFTDLSISI